MADVLSDEVQRFVRATAPESDGVLDEMDAYAQEHGFPHVGPEVGASLRFFAHMVDAQRIFEFGSGYGYSAYWFAEALPANGEIVLTEVDEDELDMAEEFMARGGFDDRARYELGDALEIVDDYDGPFDAVLLDHENHRYVEGFEAVREKVAPGGVIIADNVISASNVDFDALLAMVEGEEVGTVDRSTQGIADYFDTVQADPEFETIVLPLGEGISVSVRQA